MRIIEGIVKKLSSQNTVTVEVERLVPHKVYGKIQRRRSTFKTDSQGADVKVGDKIKIIETRPISKDKNFKIYQKEIARGSHKETQSEKHNNGKEKASESPKAKTKGKLQSQSPSKTRTKAGSFALRT